MSDWAAVVIGGVWLAMKPAELVASGDKVNYVAPPQKYEFVMRKGEARPQASPEACHIRNGYEVSVSASCVARAREEHGAVH